MYSKNRFILKHQGFTLIELMVVVAILGILAAIAVPSYTAYIERGNRADARRTLQEAAQFMERYKSANYRYSSDAGGTTAPALPTSLQVSPSSGTKRYDITVSTIGLNAFTLSAAPSGWTDNTCGTLTLTNLGEKGQGSGSADQCWNK